MKTKLLLFFQSALALNHTLLKLVIAIISIYFSTIFPSVSQQSNTSLTPKGDWCATNEVWDKLIQEDPSTALRWEQFNKEVAEYVKTHQSQKTGNKQGDVFLTVPVVFHVIWNTSAENVSTANINAQIQRLNKDFRKLNADTVNTRAVFKPLAADAQIEFCLASRDPNGFSTTGITRTFTNQTSFSVGDPLIYSTAPAWPRDQYLNLWVCDLTGAAGYAFLPGAPADRDGVVDAYYTVNGSSRVATQEVAHWFGLSHIFEDNCQGNSSTNCSTAGDRVCDTPQQNGAGFGCSFTDNTCTETPIDYPDMIENYLSYNSCQNMFTQGQVVRMQYWINAARNSLKSSLGCCIATTAVVQSYPLIEGLENPVFPPTDWIIWNPNFNVNWNRTDLTSGFGSSTACAKMFFFSPSEDITGQSDYFFSPKLDFTTLAPPITLRFNVAYARFDSLHYDSLMVRVTSSLCDSTGQIIWAEGNEQLATAPDQITEFIPNSSQWKTVQVGLDSFAGSIIQVAFDAKSGWGNNLYIDDINIMLTPPLSVAEIENAAAKKIYPNPSDGIYTLIIDDEMPDNLNIAVFNVLGEKVAAKAIKRIAEDKIMIDLSNLPNGVYFVRGFTANREAYITKVVLLHERNKQKE